MDSILSWLVTSCFEDLSYNIFYLHFRLRQSLQHISFSILWEPLQAPPLWKHMQNTYLGFLLWSYPFFKRSFYTLTIYCLSMLSWGFLIPLHLDKNLWLFAECSRNSSGEYYITLVFSYIYPPNSSIDLKCFWTFFFPLRVVSLGWVVKGR